MKAIVGQTYVHYKNKKTYVVLALGKHTETGEELVVYEGQYDDAEFGHKPVWIRPRGMFEEKVLVNGKEMNRFVKI